VKAPSVRARVNWLRLINWLRRINRRKIVIFVVSLFLFILAIQLLKSGAKVLAPFIRDVLAVQSPWNALGFGWMFAYLVLSGSPVAAMSLTLFDAGALDQVGTFAMIAGSRFGASFIVLALGFVYALRGHERKGSTAMGLLSLTVTFATCAPALLIGYWLLQNGALNGIHLGSGGQLVSVMDVLFNPLVNGVNAVLAAFLPQSAAQVMVFLLGFGVLWYSLNLIDQSLPNFKLQESGFGGMARLLYRPIITFLLGAGITTLTMSVSVSLSLLVPLSARGYIRRENVIPYIMGANITTFVDTLVAALLISKPEAFTVVLVLMISVAVVSLFILVLIYPYYERAILRLVEVVGHSRRNLAVFLLIIFGIPVALMFIR
jgi:Na+/phosphate symporter